MVFDVQERGIVELVESTLRMTQKRENFIEDNWERIEMNSEGNSISLIYSWWETSSQYIFYKNKSLNKQNNNKRGLIIKGWAKGVYY